MQKKALLGIIVAAVVVAGVVPVGYSFAQRAAITSLEFDFDRIELTDVDFSETSSFGSVQRIVANAENPSLSMLSDISSLQSSISSPTSFTLDIVANTRLTYSIFVNVHNPSGFEAIIDRAEVDILINGKKLVNPIIVAQQYKISPNQTVEVELQGISVNGKEIAGILYNVASDDFILSIDLAITSYFPTLLGEVPIPANVNLKMYLIPPKPTLTAFEEPDMSSATQSTGFIGAGAGVSNLIYRLSFNNENKVPISGKIETGVLKGNSLCNPACIVPVDHGFGAFMRIKGSSVFDVQVFESPHISLESGKTYEFEVTNPVLRSKANSAFVTRWAPDYEKISYIATTQILGVEKVKIGEFESPTFSIARKIGYNVISDFGYVGSQQFVSPDKSTTLSLSASDYDVKKGDAITFSGRLLNSYGNGIANKLIYIIDSDTIGGDQLASTRTDSTGRFEVEWAAEDTDFWNDNIDAYASFQGDSYFESSTSREVQIDVSSPIFGDESSVDTTYLTIYSDSHSASEGESLELTGRLYDSSGNGVSGRIIYIKESDIIGDDLLGMTYTDFDGYYSFDWIVEDVETFGNAEIFAEFSGDQAYAYSRSQEVEIAIETPQQPQQEYQTTELTIQVSSQVVQEGDIVTISGYLLDEDGDRLMNGIIYIKDEDTGSGDDDLGAVYTDSDGWYSFDWQATPNDPFDNVVEIFATFEGSTNYSPSRSIQIDVTIN